MRLSGASQVPALTGQGELPGKSNYLIGKDPSQWRTGVANYSRVAEMGVYPGIDLVYHGNQGQLEYDFDVAPQADPKKIRIAFEGGHGLQIDASGDLLVKVDGGELLFRRPVAFQTLGNGAKKLIPVHYALHGKNQVTFCLASYDRRQPLVIDPILSYSTYLGGSSIDAANGIAIAPDGTAFVAGGTWSSDFPTAHPLQPNAGGPHDFPQDAFVTKLSADGSTFLYSTYLGGINEDVAYAIAVDSFGYAYVAGFTRSPDFPVTPGAFNVACGGDDKCGSTYNLQGAIVSNGFVSKLNIEGSGLVYSSFLGGYENDQVLGIAVDGNSNAYVTGLTGPEAVINVIPPPVVAPPTFPITANAFQPVLGGVTDAFVTRISATGSSLIYSSYLGGSAEDIGLGITADSGGDAYVTGLTYSTNFPLSATPLQGTNEGAGDAYLTEINTNLSGAASLAYSTYFGGSGLDQGNGLALDASGNVYITGVTTSLNATLGFTRPAGAFQPQCDLDAVSVCEGDAFVLKMNPASTTPAYFTYLGGSLADAGAAIAVDTAGDAYITGSTVSVDFPIEGAVFQPTYGGGNADAYVTELNPAGSALVFSTFLGGSNTDSGAGIAVDLAGDAFITGQTCSLDFPLSSPAQLTPGGNCDAFISKVIPSGGVALSPAGLIFPNTLLSTSSAVETITLNNGGSAPLSITSITITGVETSDFAQTNTCGASVPALSQCTISVTFTPLATGTRSAQITVIDNSGTQVADLTGTGGSTPIVSYSPTSLTFATQSVGVASSPQTITITNTGTAALTITSATASGDFAVQANNCTTALQATTPPSNCTLSITFTPTIAGASVGAVTLTDNAPNSPQIILLTGTGTGSSSDFGVAVTPASTSVVAGNNASVSITVSSVGVFNSPVALSCSGLPALATCSASPSSVTPSSSSAATATLKISTTRRTSLPPGGLPRLPGSGLTARPWIWLLAALLLLSFGALAGRRNRPQWSWAVLVLTALWLASFAACGSGGTGYVNPTGTPAGTYTITVTGTSTGLTHSTTFSLTVQ
jgi:hypothetical protein